MSGQELYDIWWGTVAAEGGGCDFWEDLQEYERRAWDATAAKVVLVDG